MAQRRSRNRQSRRRRRSRRSQNQNQNENQNQRKTRRQRGGKRKVNEFFKKMMQAKKSNAQSFEYKGKNYKRQTKGHLTFYKA